MSILYCLLTFTNIFTEMCASVAMYAQREFRTAHVFNIMERSSLSLPSYVGREKWIENVLHIKIIRCKMLMDEMISHSLRYSLLIRDTQLRGVGLPGG